MPETTQHTPTPWHYGDCIQPIILIVGPGPEQRLIAQIYASGDGVGRKNVEFICRAVNCHADLLAACKAVLKAYLTEASWGDGIAGEHGPAVDSARAAIARAEGRA